MFYCVILATTTSYNLRSWSRFIPKSCLSCYSYFIN